MNIVERTRELVRELRMDGCICIDDYKNRSRTDPQCHYCEYVDLLNVAADCIESRLADNARLKEALIVFAEEGRRINEALEHLPDDFQYSLGRLNFGHLRRAAEVYGGE